MQTDGRTNTTKLIAGFGILRTRLISMFGTALKKTERKCVKLQALHNVGVLWVFGWETLVFGEPKDDSKIIIWM